MGRTLDAVARARVAVLETSGGEVGVGDADRALAFELDDHLLAAQVGVDDGAGAAVLDERLPVGSVESAVVAARDDFVTDHELSTVHDERFACELPVRLEQRAGSVVQRTSGRVRARDHRIDPAVQAGRVPVGDDRVEGLPAVRERTTLPASS